jgi:hypothetical protein
VDNGANSASTSTTALPPASEKPTENAPAAEEAAGANSPVALLPEPDVAERPAFGTDRHDYDSVANDPFARPAERPRFGSDLSPFDSDSFGAPFVG